MHINRLVCDYLPSSEGVDDDRCVLNDLRRLLESTTNDSNTIDDITPFLRCHSVYYDHILWYLVNLPVPSLIDEALPSAKGHIESNESEWKGTDLFIDKCIQMVDDLLLMFRLFLRLKSQELSAIDANQMIQAIVKIIAHISHFYRQNRPHTVSKQPNSDGSQHIIAAETWKRDTGHVLHQIIAKEAMDWHEMIGSGFIKVDEVRNQSADKFLMTLCSLLRAIIDCNIINMRTMMRSISMECMRCSLSSNTVLELVSTVLESSDPHYDKRKHNETMTPNENHSIEAESKGLGDLRVTNLFAMRKSVSIESMNTIPRESRHRKRSRGDIVCISHNANDADPSHGSKSNDISDRTESSSEDVFSIPITSIHQNQSGMKSHHSNTMNVRYDDIEGHNEAISSNLVDVGYWHEAPIAIEQEDHLDILEKDMAQTDRMNCDNAASSAVSKIGKNWVDVSTSPMNKDHDWKIFDGNNEDLKSVNAKKTRIEETPEPDAWIFDAKDAPINFGNF